MEGACRDGDQHPLYTRRDYACGILAFALAIAFIPRFPDAAGYPRWALLSLLVPLLMPQSSILLWSCCVGLLSFGLLNSPVLYDGVYYFWHFAIFIGCVLLRTPTMRPVYIGAGVGLALNGLIVAAQYWGDLDLIAEPIPNSGLFFNRNLGAEAAVLVIVGLIAQHVWYLLPFVALPLVTRPLSRGALVGLGAAGLVALFRRWPFVGVLVAIVSAGAAWRLVSIADRSFNVSVRLNFWQMTIDNLTLWGNGLGSFVQNYPWFEFAHNDLLQVAYELGAPGAVIFVGFFAYCLASGPTAERLVLVAFLVEGCFGFPLFQPFTLFIAGLAAGHVLGKRTGLCGVWGYSQLRDHARHALAYWGS